MLKDLMNYFLLSRRKNNRQKYSVQSFLQYHLNRENQYENSANKAATLIR